MTASLVVLMALAGAGRPAAVDVGRIDSVCKEAEAHGRAAKAKGVSVRVFAETSGAVMPKPREGLWRELGSEAELETLAKSARPPNTEAIVRTAGGATLVSMFFQDASASWAHLVDYCFAPGGSLTRVSGTYNTLAVDPAGTGLRRRRTTYFDADGQVVRTRSRLLDLDSEKPRAGEGFVDHDDPVYPVMRALPFSSDLWPPAPVADLDPNGVVKTVRGRLPAIKACYEAALRRTPGVAGKVVARWSIDGDGKVTTFAWESDQMKSPAFNACARRVIEKWRFPPSRGTPTSVSFPFLFESGGGGAGVTLSPTVSSNDPAPR